MGEVTISMSDHCERAELEPVLEARLDGPFRPLESDWKQRVRAVVPQRRDD